MFKSRNQSSSTSDKLSSLLVPFAFRTKDSVLVGQAVRPEAGGPCAHCVELWLRDRHVWTEPLSIDELTPAQKNCLTELLTQNDPHTFYEIPKTGHPVQLSCLVFPHPHCKCSRKTYIAPTELKKNANLAFSPIYQLKSMRYGTPSGNLWLFSATGQSPFTQKIVTAFGAHSDKQVARSKVIANWMKKATLGDLEMRIRSGSPLTAKNLLTDQTQIITNAKLVETEFKGMGSGTTQEAALIEGLNDLAKYKTLRDYSNSMKKPMLVVGVNSWLRKKVPFFLLQQYDLYPLFYPNQSPSWVVGLAAFSRITTNERPIFVFASDTKIHVALEKLIELALEHCRPMDWKSTMNRSLDGSSNGKDKNAKEEQDHKKLVASKLNLWWTNWIYRCPKIALKDVLYLEPYDKPILRWKSYLDEQGLPVSILPVNNETFPKEIQHLVKLRVPSLEVTEASTSKVRGIGSTANFLESLTS